MDLQPDNRFILIGEIVRTQGIKGKLKVRLLSDPAILTAAKGIYLESEEGHPAFFKVTASRYHKDSVLLALDGVATMSRAEELVGSRVFADTETLEDLPDGEYYWFQIIGLDAVTEDGRLLGKVEEIFPTGSNDVYVVRDSNNEYLIPAIEEIVKEIDITGGRMVISPIRGLLGEE